MARMALLLAGLPSTVPGETVNRLCSSGMSAVVQAGRAIRSGHADLIIAGGMEHMTRRLWVLSKTAKPFGNEAQLYDSSFGWRFVNPKMEEKFGTDPMGLTAENLVDLYGIRREDQDLFAYRTQRKAAQARESGRFAQEIKPVPIPQPKGAAPVPFEHDEFMKPTTSLDKLAQLKPAFRQRGTVTAANAAGLNDGAAAMLLASEGAARQFNHKPLARLVSSAVVGVEPRITGLRRGH